MRKSAFLFAATIIFAALAPSCSTSKDGGTGSGGARANASNTNRGGSRTDQEDTEAEKGPLAHKIRDARIVLRQARSDALFIIVNQGNAKRQTMAGRLELSYGDRGLAYKPLSEREVEVLRLMADGRSNGEIANRLGIATSTVKTHVHSIFHKLNATRRTQAIARARTHQLL